MEEKNSFVREVAEKKYEYGFTTDVQTDIIEKGLSEDVVRLISRKKEEPEWLLDFRLKAYRYWLTLEQPTWGHLKMPPIDYQAISYFAAPVSRKGQGAGGKGQDAGETIDPELMKTFDKLGIPLEERMALAGTAVDAVMDSVSVKTTFREKLREKGIIFCSISEAVREHPDLVREYLGSVVPYRDNFFAALNSAVFSDGSFVYIPKGVRCPMELSTYFRINARGTGQFERTLIVCDDDAYVSYLEGCTAPMRDENQLHAAIVEIVVKGQRSSTPPCRTGTRATARDGAACSTSSRSADICAARTAVSPGRRSRPAAPSPGNTPAASSRATARRLSSTAWQSPTTTSRPTRAPR